MKDNHGTINGGRVLPKYRPAFGKYLAAVCKGFEDKFGIPIYAISLQNELMFSEFYNSCIYNPEQYRETLKAVALQFKKYGIKTKIMGPEAVGASSLYEVGNEMSFIDDVESSPEASADLDWYNVHGYADDGIKAGGSRASWAMLRDRTQWYGKEMWQTETSGEPIEWPGAMTVANSLHQAIAYGNCSAWAYWQITGPTETQFSLTKGSDSTTKKYQMAKHFFKYIRPGAVRIGTLDANGRQGDTAYFNTSAYVDDAKNTMTVVMFNGDDNPVTVDYTLAGKANVPTFQAWRTTGTENFAAQPDITVTNNQFTITLPGKSVVTLFGAGDHLTPTAPTMPTNLLAQPAGLQVNLSWGKAWGGDTYTIKRATPDGPFRIIARNLTAPHYTDTNLQNDATYTYQVNAVCKGKDGPDCSPVSVTTHVADALLTPVAPNMTGAADDSWKGTHIYQIAHTIIGSFAGDPTLTSQFRSQWDSKNLYLLVEVTGAKVDFDNIEVYIDAANSKSKLYTTHDFQFAFPVATQQAQEMRRHIITGVKYQVTKTDTGYNMAITLPFQLLGIAPFQNNLYGLEVHLTHNDSQNWNTRRKKAWWSSDDTAWTTPSVFGVGRLTIPAGQPIIVLPAAKGVKTVTGNSQATISWQQVTGADGYEVKRGIKPGGPYELVCSNLTDTSYTDLGLDSDGTYYYTICAYNTGAEGKLSSEQRVKLTTPTPPAGYVAINCGGPAVGNFMADRDFTGGGGSISNYAGPIDRRIANPAPEEVYHSEHSGDVTYTIPNLPPQRNYLLRLHFREDYWNAAGKNVFNVTINDKPALTNFDIFAEAGAMYKAVIKEFPAHASAIGQLTIKLTTVVNGAKISGIELIPVKE